MATKKSTSTKKKSTAKSTPKSRSTAKSTKVTTVRAVGANKASNRTLFGMTLTRSPRLGALLAEFVGTFLLAAIVVTLSNNPLYIMFGLIGLMLMIGTLSGAHLNPLVSVAAWATRKMTAARAASYVVAQVLGGMLALVVLSAFSNAAPEQSAQAAQLGQNASELFQAAAIPDAHQWPVFFAELLGATIFGFAFASAMKQRDRIARAVTVGIGFYLALIIAGSSAAVVGATAILNPAVAVALQAINVDTIWPFAVYVFAALVGGMIGFVLNDLLSTESEGVK